MALKHLSTVLCDYLAVGERARHTLVRTYQNIAHAGEFPALKVPFCFLIELRGEGEPFRVTLEGPAGVEQILEGTADKPASVQGYQQWATTLAIEAQAFAFPQPGLYAIVVYSGDQESHRREFAVSQVEKSDPEMEQEATEQVEPCR